MELVGQHFRPEFINRIDETVVFHSLGKAQIEKIAAIQINYLTHRLQQQDIGLDVSAEALSHLAETGFDPVYGARPLKRIIQQQLENPLAQALLTGKFKSGDKIEVIYDKGAFQFNLKN
jgi:ATP-dependent Clp protease ATP-binding subunit ClpB